MTKLIVSTWVRHQGQQQMTDSHARTQSLRTAIQATAARIGASNYDSGGLIKGIFVAPEYFFAAKYAGLQTNTGKRMPRPIGQSEHAILLQRLTAISREFPRILILPGSVAWKKPLELGEWKARVKYYQGRAIHKPPLSGDQLSRALRGEYQWSREDGTLTDSDVRRQYERDNDIAMPTEVLSDADLESLRTGNPTLYDVMVQTVSAMGALGQGAKAAVARYNSNPSAFKHMMQNTAYAFLNGQVVFQYSKQANCLEEVGDDTLLFAPGARSGIQEIEGIRFGFEVCVDHNLGTLNRQLREGRQLDVQVLMSDWANYDPGHAVVRDGGFFVHASTNPSVAGVWQLNQYQAVRAPTLGVDSVDGTPLTHWDMEVDVYDPFDLSGTFMQNPGSLFPVKKWSVQTTRNPFRSVG